MESIVAPRAAQSASDDAADSAVSVVLAVPHMVCGGCVRTIEQALRASPGVAAARANLSARRVAITFDARETSSAGLVGVLQNEASRQPK